LQQALSVFSIYDVVYDDFVTLPLHTSIIEGNGQIAEPGARRQPA
jgi:hypothetical protein